ncbi:MAG: methyltransferase domain-containing protein [Phycisphaerales bacterium]
MTTKPSRPAPPASRTLGPVDDLERHLPSDWWRTLFNAVYLKTDGDVVENAENTARDVDVLLSATGITTETSILDLCCGQGRHALELAGRGYTNVTGVDRSRYLVRLARKRAAALNLDVNFHEGDARRFRIPPERFECVAIMGNSFGYFEREHEDQQILDRVRNALVPGGVLALDLVDGEWLSQHFEPRSWEWIDQNHFVCRERSLARDGRRLVCREVVVHAERGVIADQFYAERLFSREGIERSLTNAGFIDVVHHGILRSGSDRNQDLGMMGRRMFVTARTSITSPVAAARTQPITVTVLLGDPSLPDTVKLGGQFNPEDLDTVQRLKDALAPLSRYTFTYFDHHQGLIDHLRSNKPDMVFNLCDEGFRNDAFLELHVPALLEMLEIPYTGAGPGCLASCYDKAMVRAVAASLEISVPLETYVAADDKAATLPSVFPALLKPNFGDSSIGITQHAVVRTPEELITYLVQLHGQMPGQPVLVQEFLPGAEYSVSLIGNPGISMQVLPVLEVDYSGLDPALPRILGYESKWDPKSPYWTKVKYHKATKLDADLKRMMVDSSITLFERLRCRDYARFDFRCGADGQPRMLEVNPNPGWCWDGKFNLMAEMDGFTYTDTLRMILDAAVDRLGLGRQRTAKTASKGRLVKTQ